jgi:hypothetical protein
MNYFYIFTFLFILFYKFKINKKIKLMLLLNIHLIYVLFFIIILFNSYLTFHNLNINLNYEMLNNHYFIVCDYNLKINLYNIYNFFTYNEILYNLKEKEKIIINIKNIIININIDNKIWKFQNILSHFNIINLITIFEKINFNKIFIFSNNFIDYQLIIVNKNNFFLEKKNYSTFYLFQLIILIYFIKYYFYKNILK